MFSVSFVVLRRIYLLCPRREAKEQTKVLCHDRGSICLPFVF